MNPTGDAPRQTMKRNTIFTVIGTILGVCGVTALRETRTQRELGRRPLAGTSLTVLITQSRSIGAPVGLGDAKTWLSIVDQSGTWRQTQRIDWVGREANEWATWNAPDRVALRTEADFQVVDIPLKYPSGSTVAHEVVIGVSPAERSAPESPVDLPPTGLGH